MILDLIIGALLAPLWIIMRLITLLPDVSNISGIGAGIALASNYLAGLNNFLPVSTLLACLGVVIAYETAYFAFKLIYWVIKRIPTQA
jgi:hypothetical protein